MLLFLILDIKLANYKVLVSLSKHLQFVDKVSGVWKYAIMNVVIWIKNKYIDEDYHNFIIWLGKLSNR